MLRLRKLPLLLIALPGYLVILFTFSGSASPAYGQDRPAVPSFGKGACEVIFFSDYFCPPCGRLDANIEPAVTELLATGKVKIAFIDVPLSKATPIYARYYLYAVHAGADVQEILRIRSRLFHAAQFLNIQKQEALEKYLGEQKITWKEYDVKPVFQVLNAVIRQNRIDATPSCIIRYSPSEVKKYVGTDEIWDGLSKLKSRLGIKK
jgi:protein-disulfide isomerase